MEKVVPEHLREENFYAIFRQLLKIDVQRT